MTKRKLTTILVLILAALLCAAAIVLILVKQHRPETVWEREMPEFRTTLMVMKDGDGYCLNRTHPDRWSYHTKSEDVALDQSAGDEGVLLTGNRTYYDPEQNRMTHDSLTVYLLTAEDTTGMQNVVHEQPGLRYDITVLDGETLVILCVQDQSIEPEAVDVLDMGRMLALGET